MFAANNNKKIANRDSRGNKLDVRRSARRSGNWFETDESSSRGRLNHHHHPRRLAWWRKQPFSYHLVNFLLHSSASSSSYFHVPQISLPIVPIVSLLYKMEESPNFKEREREKNPHIEEGNKNFITFQDFFLLLFHYSLLLMLSNHYSSMSEREATLLSHTRWERGEKPNENIYNQSFSLQ